MEISHRIKMIRDKNNLNIQELADVLGEKRQRIQDIELKRQKVPQEVLTRIVEKLHINADWLLTGKGEMYRQAESDAP